MAAPLGARSRAAAYTRISNIDPKSHFAVKVKELEHEGLTGEVAGLGSASAAGRRAGPQCRVLAMLGNYSHLTDESVEHPQHT
jgi:hypothetical protein